ncbi:MAG: phosphate ABC transporter substrate-binding protein [Nitrospirae bacterium]|nr:MAG: phosphate ABC transporter substrate-binding protein [Nitrospirota bacterium]
MSKGGLRLSIFIVLSALLFLTTPSFSQPSSKVIKINGSSTVRPVVRIAARVFGRKHKIRFEVKGGGSSKGVRSAGQGIVDIGMASRYLKDSEKQKYPDLIHHTIGYDGIAVIVNSKNPIKNITKKEIQGIYTGRIRNWKELGGPDMKITFISKEEGRSTLDLFIEYAHLEVKQEGEKMFHRIKGYKNFSKVPAEVIGPNSMAIVKVAENPGAIAYVSIGAAERAEHKLGKIKRLSLEGVEATKENVKNGTYPITRPLNVVTKGKPTGIIKKFIDYLYSRQGQNIVKNLDYIPLR